MASYDASSNISSGRARYEGTGGDGQRGVALREREAQHGARRRRRVDDHRGRLRGERASRRETEEGDEEAQHPPRP
jgi:hypothetical protein